MSVSIREFRRDLRRIERHVIGHLKDQTACCGVTAAQCHVLLELEEAEESTLNGLADRLRLDASTLSRTVESLVRSGMVDRSANPRDRRAVALRLTPVGMRKVQSINESCDVFYRDVFEGIPADRHAALVDSIKTVADILSEGPAPQGRDAPCACAKE